MEKKIKDSKSNFEKKQSSTKKKIEKLKKKKGNLVLKWMDEAITQDQYEVALTVIDREIEYVEEQIRVLTDSSNIEKEVETLNRIRNQMESLKSFDEINREIINRFVDKIIVHEDSTIDIHYAFSNENLKL